ncbi:MAG: hypothetical protein JWO36_4201 [Myxococcales bacterium]|nr:hypothetical protein [Myxococcales bacterium]
MKQLALIVILAAVVACGKKTNPDQAAVDHYVNVELAPHMSEWLAGRRNFDHIKPDLVTDETLRDHAHDMLRDYSIPMIQASYDAIGKLKPPEAMASLHGKLLEMQKSYLDAGAAMLPAIEARDVEKYQAAHAKIMETVERETWWNKNFDEMLANSDVKLADFPPPPAKPPGK